MTMVKVTMSEGCNSVYNLHEEAGDFISGVKRARALSGGCLPDGFVRVVDEASGCKWELAGPVGAIPHLDLYGEDGVAIWLSRYGDVCANRDEDSLVRVSGHSLYVCTLEEAREQIARAYCRLFPTSRAARNRAEAEAAA
jgi:hypothetical protein